MNKPKEEFGICPLTWHRQIEEEEGDQCYQPCSCVRDCEWYNESRQECSIKTLNHRLAELVTAVYEAQ